MGTGLRPVTPRYIASLREAQPPLLSPQNRVGEKISARKDGRIFCHRREAVSKSRAIDFMYMRFVSRVLLKAA
jgi:hypothetical protein